MTMAEWLSARLDRSVARRVAKERFRAAFPRAGFLEGRTPAPLVDRLTDGQLDALNRILDWNCFTVDAQGRRFGWPANAGKRDVAETIPDPRVVRMHERFDLSDKRVLEVGCFEGIHTIALCRLARSVVAIDARVENVVKTIVRCAFFGVHPTVFPFDVETPGAPPPELQCDVVHHVGVLYHLADPVRHLRRLAATTRVGIMLDTTYAEPAQATLAYDVEGVRFAYHRFREDAPDNVFAGTLDHARWLTLDGLREALRLAGFMDVDVEWTRPVKHGVRALIFARRA